MLTCTRPMIAATVAASRLTPISVATSALPMCRVQDFGFGWKEAGEGV